MTKKKFIVGMILFLMISSVSAFAESINKTNVPVVLVYGTQGTGGILPVLIDSNGRVYVTGTMTISGNVAVIQSAASNLKAQVEITSPINSNMGRLICDDYLGYSVKVQNNTGAQTNTVIITGVAEQKVQIKAIYLFNYSSTDAVVTLDWTGGTLVNKAYLSGKQSLGWDCPYLSPTGEGLRISYTEAANIVLTIIYLQGAY
ncbi:MAG: hypothetical protein AB1478_01785 [Nitrospirota bacterium]